MHRLKRKEKNFLKAFLRDKHECQMEMRNGFGQFYTDIYKVLIMSETLETRF